MIMPKENYDYGFIIRQLANEFKGNFDCLGENTKKYITSSVPIKKELKNGEVVIYNLKFIDSYRFMSTSLSSLIYNSTEINNTTKEPEDEFINNMRSMTALLSSHINDLSKINKKQPKNKFIDNMRSMSALLSSHINDLSEINKKEPEKESENEFINSLSSMSTLLSNLIDNLSEINKKEPEKIY